MRRILLSFKKSTTIFFLVVCLCLSGCADGMDDTSFSGAASASNANPVSDDASTGTSQDSITSSANEEPESNPIETFYMIVPEAEIVDSIVQDLNGDGKDDAVILYVVNSDDQQKAVSSGVSVCLNGIDYSGISAVDRKEVVFFSELSISQTEECLDIFFDLKDTNSGTVYDYTVKYKYVASEKLSDYTIIAKEKE